MLLVAVLLILAALGAADPDLQPSAVRLMVTSVVALLAPLFWPGIAATPAHTALRVVGWSVAAACLAALALGVFAAALQPALRVFAACAMLALILIVTHAVAAILERRWHSLSADAQGARDLASRSAALALALLGSMPLWFGPAAELLSARHDWVVDTVLGVSPLTHLAVASGNDLLRNQWLYKHSNLASLQTSYPALAVLAWGYAIACLLLVLTAMAFHRGRRPVNSASPPFPPRRKRNE
jgi:hypothetical protein